MLKRAALVTALLGAMITMTAAAVPAVQAQTAPTARAYYIADFTLTDPDGIRPYSAGVPATLEAYGGRFVARGGRIAALEGAAPGARTVIIEFPNLERAQAWYASDAYSALRPIRQRSGISRVFIIEGLPN